MITAAAAGGMSLFAKYSINFELPVNQNIPLPTGLNYKNGRMAPYGGVHTPYSIHSFK
jgi:hypothetical protein